MPSRIPLTFALLCGGCLPHHGLTQAAPTAKSAHLLTLQAAPKIDGNGRDWPAQGKQTLKGAEGEISFQIAGDADNFYALVQVADKSPLKNNAARPQENLKGGDAVAFYFGGEPGTEQRILASRRNDTDEVYAYRPKSKVKKPYTFASPTGQVEFDYVAPLAEAKAKFTPTPSGYTLEVALPWKSLGMQSKPASFPFEFQVIYSDPAGTTNVAMTWWHSAANPGDTVEDLPSEARLYPTTWGVASTTQDAPTAIAETTVNISGVPVRLELPRAGRVTLVVTDSSG